MTSHRLTRIRLTLCLCLAAASTAASGQGSEALLSDLGLVGPAEVRGGSAVRIYLGYTVNTVNYLPTYTTVSVDNAQGSPLEPLLIAQAQGQARRELDIPTQAVRTRQRVTVKAEDEGVVKQVVFTVLPPEIALLEILATGLEGGSGAEGRIQLSTPASPAGAVIALRSSEPTVVVIPPTAIVPPGQTQGTFPVLVNSVAVPRPVDLTATLEPSMKSVRLNVGAPTLLHFELSSLEATGGDPVEGYLALSSPAPPAGLVVTLRSSDRQSAAVTGSVPVAPGADEARFTVLTAAVGAATSVSISATLRGATLRETLTVLPPILAAVRLSPPGLIGGRAGTGSVELNGRTAATPVRVALRSARADLVSVPQEVVIAPGAASALFALTTTHVAGLEGVAITATHAGQVENATITLVPARMGDWDGDGDVDLRDFLQLQRCFAGAKAPGTPVPSPDCRAVFDFEPDGDIDLDDYLAFEALLSGPDAGPRTRVELDASIAPVLPQLPGWSAGAPRPVAALIDGNGRQADFVANEVLVVSDDAVKVSSLIQRWNGVEVFTFKPRDHGGDSPAHHVIRVNAARGDVGRLEDDLQDLSPEDGGLLRVSSPAGLGLLAIAAREAAEGMNVGVNWVAQADGIREQETLEEPIGGGSAPGYSENSFKWGFLTDHRVPQAWRALDFAGRLGNKIPMAIIDGGFAADADWPPGHRGTSVAPFYPWGSANPMSCNGNECPWHGTNVTSTAMGLVGNRHGAAGVAGPVAAGPITIQTLGDMFTSIFAVRLAVAAGARIINMSFGVPVPAPLSWSVNPFNGETTVARSLGRLIFASSGNKGEDVDSEDCFIVCWEDTWYTPCENTGVICVGGTQPGGRDRHALSNHGAEEVDIHAPFTVWVGPDPANAEPRMASGTSHASPYAAGVAALIWAVDPGMSANQVESILYETAWQGNGLRSVNAFDGVVKALGSQPPSVRILLPVDGGSFPDTFSGTDIAFAADATDPEDGVPEVVWTSSLQGEIGRGTAFVRSDLIPGTHVIKAQATDSSGILSTHQVVIRVNAVLPSLWIFKPGPQTELYEAERVILQAESFDRAGTGARLADARVSWRSSVHGNLGTGHDNSAFLARGTHTLTVRGVSANGAAGEAMVTVVVKPPRENRQPTVEIITPGNGFRGPSDRVLLGSCSKDLPVVGRAIDNYTGLAIPAENVIWVTDRSDLQHPILGTGAQATLNLRMKACDETTVHMLTLTATDSRGNRKPSQFSQRIEITAPPK